MRAFDLAGVLLREFDHQNAGVVLALDFLGLYVAHVEGSLAGAGVALLTDDAAGLLVLLVLLNALGGGNGEVALLQLDADFVLLEAGQVDGQLVAVLGLVHVGLHDAGSVLAVQSLVGIPYAAAERVVEQIVKQVFTEHHRQHRDNFLSNFAVSFLCPRRAVFMRAARAGCKLVRTRNPVVRSLSFGTRIVYYALLALSIGEC